jgi:hypothetical protein
LSGDYLIDTLWILGDSVYAESQIQRIAKAVRIGRVARAFDLAETATNRGAPSSRFWRGGNDAADAGRF